MKLDLYQKKKGGGRSSGAIIKEIQVQTHYFY